MKMVWSKGVVKKWGSLYHATLVGYREVSSPEVRLTQLLEPMLAVGGPELHEGSSGSVQR